MYNKTKYIKINSDLHDKLVKIAESEGIDFPEFIQDSLEGISEEYDIDLEEDDTEIFEDDDESQIDEE